MFCYELLNKMANSSIEKSEEGSSQEAVELARNQSYDTVEEPHVTPKTWIVVGVSQAPKI